MAPKVMTLHGAKTISFDAMADSTPITWSTLLAKWTDFARSAVALPPTGEPGRWRASVADIIALQAVTFALGELDEVRDASERALALDRAEIALRAHAASLHDLWRGEPLPQSLAELVDDCRAVLHAARNCGVEWIVVGEELIARHPAELVTQLLSGGFAGDLVVPAPGIPLFCGCPAAFLRGPAGNPPADKQIEAVDAFLGEEAEPTEHLAQFSMPYRQFDFAKGGPVRDLVVPFDSALPGGQPLLVFAIQRGEPQGVSLPPRGKVSVARIPVVFGEDE